MKRTTPARAAARETLPVLLGGNLVFFVLYSRFLTGRAVYLYTDIGSDSVASSLPLITLLERMFRAGRFGGYELTAGLGSDTTATFMKYLNPVKTPLLFFTPGTLPAGLMLTLFLEINCLLFFSWLFFRRLLGHKTAAAAASLIWTFSGYVTLWSQNLTAGAALAAFTVMMAALLPVLFDPTPRRGLMLALAIALLLLTDYYYAYMSAWFVLVFVLFFALRRRMPLRRTGNRMLLILMAAAGACGLAAASLVPALSSFTGSVRTGAASGVFRGIEWNSPASLLTSLGRLFSVNLFGAGSDYRGAGNYYEQAALSVSCLALPSLSDRLLSRKSRPSAIAALALGLLALCSKNAAALLQFNRMVQRYSFLITFALTCAVGFFLKDLLTGADRRRCRRSAAAGAAITLAALAVLRKLDGRFGLETDIRAMGQTAVFALLFCLLIFLITRTDRPAPACLSLLLPLLMAELIVTNRPTLYDRDYVTPSAYASVLSSGETGKAVKEIRSRDSGLFRVGATEDPTDANVGTRLGFPAASVYSSTNPASLGTLKQEMGLGQISANHFVSGGSEFGAFPLLGGRYLIRNRTERLSDTLPEALFETIRTDEGALRVSRVRNALPFGYLYTRTVSSGTLASLAFPQRMLALFGACHLTGGGTEEAGETAADGISGLPALSGSEISALSARLSSRDLLDSGTEANQLTVSDASDSISAMKVFRPSGSDPYLYYDLGGVTAKGSVRLLSIHVRGTRSMSSIRRMEVFCLRKGQTDPDPEDRLPFSIEPGMPDLLLLLPDEAARIRLDFPSDGGTTRLSRLSVLTLEDAGSLLEPLASTDVSGIQMDGGTYRASLRSDKDGIFCVPVLWNANWRAKVNGRSAKVLNINGGLVGIPVSGGKSDIRLVYRSSENRAALRLSGSLLLLWLAAYIAAARREKARGQ